MYKAIPLPINFQFFSSLSPPRELSRITLADADPGAGAPSPDAPLYYAASNTPVASLLPPHPLDHNEL